jgi:hypothetical protein
VHQGRERQIRPHAHAPAPRAAGPRATPHRAADQGLGSPLQRPGRRRPCAWLTGTPLGTTRASRLAALGLAA